MTTRKIETVKQNDKKKTNTLIIQDGRNNILEHRKMIAAKFKVMKRTLDCGIAISNDHFSTLLFSQTLKQKNSHLSKC